jgi:negative regulator of sigma E activity
MPNKHAEELCAMMDGELGQSEARFLLKRLGHEQQLIACWKRYHFSRAVLRGEIAVQPKCLCDRVSAAIEQEPTPAIEPVSASSLLPAWLQPVAGFAVAATVAIAAFTLLQTEQLEPATDQAADSARVAATEQVPPLAFRAQTASSTGGPGNPRLQAYVMRHNAVASPRRGRDLVPYVYLVTTPVGEAEKDEDPGAEASKNQQQQPVAGANE